MELNEVMDKLYSMKNQANIEGMARYGIKAEGNLGVSMPALRNLAKEIRMEARRENPEGTGKDHELAEKLWETGIREARMLACFIDDPNEMTGDLLDKRVADFDSWDICDTCCGSLFDRTDLAYEKAVEWTSREEEFVKRAGFVMMAWLAVHDKKAGDEVFEEYFPIIVREAHDERNFVKKAVNWALRSIGKRNLVLNARAIEVADELAERDSRAARWIGKDALRELMSDKVRERLMAKERKAKK